AIALIYFADFYDGRWDFLDDFIYAQQGADLIAAGYNPISALVTAHGRERMFTRSTGVHILYPWSHLRAEYGFGQSYRAAVFLNVLLTFVVGSATARMLEDFGFSRRYVRGFLILFLLHIEVLLWSSIVNLKDILILALAAPAL